MTTALNTLSLNNMTCQLDDSNIAWVAINCPNSSVNRLSADTMAELALVLDHFQQTAPAGLIFYSSKETGFIAGADIDEFAGLDSPEKATELVGRGWHLFNRLAQVAYPTLALIHGHCLGGGLELALACRYRLVVDQPDTSLALPEVMLGIFPGWGGMLRLPQVVGAPAALDMMLTGRNIDASRAKAIGLADGLVPPRLMHQAAKAMVISQARPHRPRGVAAWLNQPWLRFIVVNASNKKLDQRDPKHHYPAPRAILTIWAKHDGDALQAPDLIHKIIQSDTAKNLLRVFRLQERLKGFAKAQPDTQPVQRVHVVGAGVMGGDIAAWCALKGIIVTLQDRDTDLIAFAQGRANTLFKRRLKNLYLARAAADRLIPDPNGYGVGNADLIIEAITENLDAKRALYAALEPHMKPDAILASNTSSLLLEDLRKNLRAPERFIGLHFFNPVAKMPLVEVVATPETSTQAKMAGYAFVGQISKLPLPVLSAPGFLVNAVLAPYMLEAMRCVDEGISFEVIDAAMVAFGMPVGPIELIDTVGLDIAHAAGAQLSDDVTFPHCLEARLSRNELGKKSGHGFYRWKDQKPVKKKPGPIPVGLAYRLIQPLLDKTQAQLNNGIVADADLADAGVIFGTGFAPFTGGPLQYLMKHPNLAATSP